jgi:cytochrome b
MKTKTNLLIDSIIFLAFLLAMEPRITGEQIHEWLGAAFFLTLLVHLILHWKWVVNTVGKFFKKMALSSRINLIIDFLIFIAFITLNVSGLMISKTLLSSLGISLAHGGSWKQIHSLAADVTVYLLAIHIALHWKWVSSAFNLHILKPSMRLFERPEKLEPVPVPIDRD